MEAAGPCSDDRGRGREGVGDGCHEPFLTLGRLRIVDLQNWGGI